MFKATWGRVTIFVAIESICMNFVHGRGYDDLLQRPVNYAIISSEAPKRRDSLQAKRNISCIVAKVARKNYILLEG